GFPQIAPIFVWDGSAWHSLYNNVTTMVHSDSRSLNWDVNGNLWLTSDGGIYKGTKPPPAGQSPPMLTWVRRTMRKTRRSGLSPTYSAGFPRSTDDNAGGRRRRV